MNHRKAARCTWAGFCATFAVAGIVVLAAGCSTQQNANSNEHSIDNAGEVLILANQPPPIFPSSALRLNLIEVEAIQALGSPTTTFFFPEGTTVVNAGGKPLFTAPPFKVCPSQGEPIHATDSLTNPLQVTSGGEVVGQPDPNGIYAGASTGTYVLCDGASGTPKMSYWEGPVFTETGTAVWNADGGSGQQIQDVGPSQLPVCTQLTSHGGDGTGLKAGTPYYDCKKARA